MRKFYKVTQTIYATIISYNSVELYTKLKNAGTSENYYPLKQKTLSNDIKQVRKEVIRRKIIENNIPKLPSHTRRL